MEIKLCIYILGFIMAFFMGRRTCIQVDKDLQQSWGNILLMLLFALVSWVAFGMFLILFVIDFLGRSNYTFPKPPKWL